MLESTRGPRALTDNILGSVFLLSTVFSGILEDTDVFVSQENLALGIGGPRLSIWVSVSELVTSLDVDLSTLGDGTEEGIRNGAEREDGVP